MDEEDADEAEFDEEAKHLVLNDFFRGGDAVREGGVHGGAGATEADAKEEVPRRPQPGAEGDSVETETDVGGFGDVAFENGVFLLDGGDNFIREIIGFGEVGFGGGDEVVGEVG